MKRTARLYRNFIVLAIWLPVLSEILWSVRSEHLTYAHCKREIEELAEVKASSEAFLVQRRLLDQFSDLSMAAQGIIGQRSAAALSPKTDSQLRSFVAGHPDIHDLAVLSSDGHRVLWSRHSQLIGPDFRSMAFTPVPEHVGLALGNTLLSGQNGDRFVVLRYEMKDPLGHILYLLEASLRINVPLSSQSNGPFSLAVRALGDPTQPGIQARRNGINQASQQRGSVQAPVSNMPFAVQASWSQTLVSDRYAEGLQERWAARAMILLLLVGSALLILLLMRKSQRQAMRVARLSSFHAMLAKVNCVLAEAQDEDAILKNICALVVQHTDVARAWIGRRDAKGSFQFLASAGLTTGYLDGLVLPADPIGPAGFGTSGNIWRDGQAHFTPGSKEQDWLEFWRDPTLRTGPGADAALPIHRGGELWAVMKLYFRDQDMDDEELRSILRNLAENLSQGLDRLDLAHRERTMNAFNIALFESLTSGVCVARYPERTIESVNAHLLQMFGASSREEMHLHAVRDLYPDEASYDRGRERAAEVLRNGYGMFSDLPYRRLDGTVIFVDLAGRRLDGDEATKRIVWTFVDATERHEREAAIQRLSVQRATLLANTVAGIDLVRYPECIFEEVNQGFLSLLGYESPAEVIGRRTSEFYASAREDERMKVLSRKVLAEGAAGLRDLQVRRKDGQVIYLDVQGRRLDGGDPQHPVIVWTSVDVTERKHLTDELVRQAQYDALTGLPNRRAFEQHLRVALARAQRHGTLLAVAMVDLDDFKPVNDMFGHDVGDELLRKVGERLQSSLRASDFIARVGGDEFVVVLEDLERDKLGSQLQVVIDRMEDAMHSHISLGEERSIQVTMSMGIALYPSDAEAPDDLLRLADAAMYEVKTHKTQRPQWWALSSALALLTADRSA